MLRSVIHGDLVNVLGPADIDDASTVLGQEVNISLGSWFPSLGTPILVLRMFLMLCVFVLLLFLVALILIVSVNDIDELSDTYTRGGASVTYHRDMLSEHLLLHPMSTPMTLRWLRERFAGQPLRTHIARTKWPTLLNPSTYRGMLRLGVITAKVMTGRRVERQPLSKFDL